jgi:hypothetical protein
MGAFTENRNAFICAFVAFGAKLFVRIRSFGAAAADNGIS